jgi:putative ABC transport system substrate-binding protein
MRRRDFITLIGGAGVWPFAAQAQRPVVPVVGFVDGGAPDVSAPRPTAFRKGLNESGYFERQNVTLEYHWMEGQYDQLPELMADLVHRRVAVIATSTSVPAALAAKAATTTIPIVFSVGIDPVKIGLVASLAQPGGNVTGINFLAEEVIAKGLRLLRDLIPKAVRIAVFVNPRNVAIAKPILRNVEDAAPTMGVRIQVLNASTVDEIDAAFASFERDPPDAFIVIPDNFFYGRRAQFVTLAARDKIPGAYWDRDIAAAGGLMSYGADLAEACRQAGVYTGSILKGARPANLPVLQASKFTFVVNLTTAKALGLTIPASMLSLADELIE